MRDRSLLWILALAAGAVTVSVVVSTLSPRKPERPFSLSNEELASAQAQPAPMIAELKREIASAKPAESDIASRKMMEVGHALAKKKNFADARQAFQVIDANYKGTGSKHPDYGSIPDQAKYQSIVCLVAEGKTEEARKEFRAFIKERPESSLMALAFRRLVRLNGGVEDPSDIALYETSLRKQEEATRKAVAACGPKVIERYLQFHLNRPTQGLELVKMARQTEEGTSMLDMVRALTQLKIGSESLEVNAADFVRQRVPFVWLKADHYVLVEKVNRDEILTYDPLLGGTRTEKSPAPDSAEFRAPILLLSPH